MRRSACAILLLLAGCDALEPFDPQPMKDEKTREEARAAFEAWRAALVAGKSEEAWQGISEGNRSQWLFGLLSESDPLASEWRRTLQGSPRVDLDLWFEFCRKHKLQRAELLPGTVAAHPSLLKLWKDVFALQSGAIKYQMSRLEILEVYADAGGVTVSARNALGRTEFYAMGLEPGGWKVDHTRSSLRAANR
jgi:hypothetical protein